MRRFKERRGSLLLVLTFCLVMAWVTMSMLTLATNLYQGTRSSAQIYADIQTYRAGIELACYQYITDIQGVIVTKDLDGDWLTVSDDAVYSQALEAIKELVASDDDANRWKVTDLVTALSGANISNPDILADLFAKVSGVKQYFSLVVPELWILDWSDTDSWGNSSGAHVALKPFVVEIQLDVRGESVSETFTVDGLYLDVTLSDETVDGSRHEIATMQLVEKEEGVSITREQIEEA